MRRQGATHPAALHGADFEAAEEIKVFCFFSSEKKIFLLGRPASPTRDAGFGAFFYPSESALTVMQ